MARIPTPRQEQAIKAQEPVVVVTAGAGSGKTFVLIERILDFLQQRRGELWQVAAITFTNKATQEMRQRLQERLHEKVRTAPAIEREYWRRQLESVGDAAILTIHAFCRRILAAVGVVIGVDPYFDVSGEGIGMGEIVHDVVGRHLDDNSLTSRYEPWRVRKYVTQLLDQLEQLGTTPEQARRETVDRLRDQVTEGDRLYLSVQHLFDLALAAHEEGLERRLAARRLNSNDLLRLTRLLLEQEPHIGHQVADRYPFILVDEFQDTDPVQVSILRALLGTSVPPQLTVVGDPKQSIYRFRGADVQAFAQMVTDMTGQGRKPVSLSENFRSVAPIVTAVNTVFASHAAPFKDGEMVPQRKNVAGSRRVVGFRLKRGESPAKGTVKRIRALLRAQPYPGAGGGGLHEGDLAVLCRTGTQVTRVGQELARARIDHVLLGGQGFWQAPEIVEVALVLKAVTTSTKDTTYAALTGPYFSVNPDVVRQALAALPRQSVWNWDGAPEEIAAGTDRDLLDRAVRCLTQLHDLAAIAPPAMVLEVLWQQTGRRLQFRRSGRLQALANLEKLKKLAHAQEGMVHTFQFARFMVGMYQFATLEPQAELVTESARVIRVATIHKSKGLEFPVVFLPYVERNLLRGNDDSALIYLRGKGLAFRFHSRDCTPDWFEFSREDRDASLAEEERVLYVALTRAQEGLHVVSGESRHQYTWLSWLDSHLQWQD